MPKRPCAILVAPDNQTILSGDKFGDVYSLPLIPSESDGHPENGDSGLSTPVPKNSERPAADASTVHTKRNRRALLMQKRQIEELGRDPKAERPNFEHQLLLGHVSLLTDLIIASHNEKRYILTSDRDEHIRISRFIPQTHVIESFCLGHQQFISSLSIPLLQPNILISGGGDNELFVWEWPTARLISKTPLLQHAQSVTESTTEIAVSKLESTTLEPGNTAVLVICEAYVFTPTPLTLFSPVYKEAADKFTL
jgi:tRNA (guanine-N(7)-)-methyltransferase subunit TRM82